MSTTSHISRIVGFCVMLCLAFPGFSAAERARIAIQDILVSDGVKEQVQKHLDSNLLLGELETAVQRTNKFQLVPRQKKTLQAIRKEQKFANSSATAGDAAFEGQFSNADYLIIPEVMQFSFYRETKPIPHLPGKYRYRDFGDLQINVSVADSTTGVIKASFPLKTAFSTTFEVTSQQSGVPPKSHFISMSRKSAIQLANNLVDFAFPMKVIKNDGTKVWINRGQDGGLSMGQVLNIYSAGDDLIDPDTGERLGSAEDYIGTLKIIDVKPKFSIAEIENLTPANLVEVGAIARKQN
ncbi:MAG: hypothetical protein JEZ02_12030 [Desulfatibacillum sp.]|nr:hypothetical protein [Desulfatibacillum sp.]